LKAGFVILAALVLVGIKLGGLLHPPLRLGSLAPSTFTWVIFALALGYVSAISRRGRLFEGRVRALGPWCNPGVRGIHALNRLAAAQFT
jgi:hypothetical protein